eukprot:scaffold11122_cov63-Phaeocystis_antarctica.AAC.1
MHEPIGARRKCYVSVAAAAATQYAPSCRRSKPPNSMNERNPALSYALSCLSSSSCSRDAGSRRPASSSAAQSRVQYGSSTCTRCPRRGPTAANDSRLHGHAVPQLNHNLRHQPLEHEPLLLLCTPPAAAGGSGRRYRLPVASTPEQHLESERRPAILRQCRARRLV